MLDMGWIVTEEESGRRVMAWEAVKKKRRNNRGGVFIKHFFLR
jgi:hypothetical protein